MEIAQQFITSHTYDTVLVIGAEKLTSITNWTDRNTCVLFGDGAGAAILRHRGGGTHGVISTYIGSDGQFTDILVHARWRMSHADHARECGSTPAHHPHVGQGCLQTGGHRDAGAPRRRRSPQAGLTIDDIACVIPHQANMRIIEANRRPAEDSDRTIFRESRPLWKYVRGGGRDRAR